MNIWKRFLSLALVFALVLSMGPIIPFVQANAETETATAPAEEMVWDFDEGTAIGWAENDSTKGYAVVDGKLTWVSKSSTQVAGTTAANAYNGRTNLLTVEGDDTWTSYEISTDVCVANTTSVFSHSNFMPMVGLVVYYGDSANTNSIQIRVRPTSTPNKYSVRICTPATAGTGTPAFNGNVTVNGNMTAEKLATAATFNLKVRVNNGVVSVYIDDQFACSGDVNTTYGKTFTGGVGLMNWTTASASTAKETVSFDNFTVAPIYVPEADMGGKVVAWYESANSGNTIDASLWTASNSNYTITDGKIVSTGSFKLSSNVTFRHGSIVAEVTLPATNTLTANATAAHVNLFNNASQEFLGRFQWSNSSATMQLAVGIRDEKTTTMDRYGGGAQGNFPGKTNNDAWGVTYIVKVLRVGNYVSVSFTNKATGVEFASWAYNLNPAYTINGLDFLMNGCINAGMAGVTFDNIIVTSFDDIAGQLTLPATGITADERAEISAGLLAGGTTADPNGKETFDRTHYVAGETVTLTVDTDALDIATLKVNDGAVETNVSGNTVTFVMPEGDAEVTCGGYVFYNVNVIDGVTTDQTTAKEGETVELTVDTSVLDITTLQVNGGAVNVNVDGNKVTFTMPAGDVTITCEEKQLPANEELDSNDGTAALDTNLWDAAGTASNGAISILPGSNTGSASNYFGTAMSDGWIKADITLPTISEAELQTNKEGTGAMFYGVRMKNGSATIEADIWYQRNTTTSATAPKTGTTTLRLYFRNTGYTNGAFGPTISLPTDIWTTGATITLELRKVGNFIELKATCPTIADANKTVACTVDTSKFIAGNWQFGLYADNPQLYTDWTLANKVDGTAYFDNIEVGRINKTASVTVDPTAAALVGLPSVDEFWIYNKAAGVTSGDPHARDAYQVGETIALTPVLGYDYYANGEKIEDPENFVIPDAETVNITAAEQEVYMPEADMGGTVVGWHESANTPDGVIDTDMWTTSGTSSMVDGAISAGANFKLYTKSNGYANGYIEADVTITEGNMESLESGTKYGANIEARWNLSSQEARPRFKITKAADGTYSATLQLVGYASDWSGPSFGPDYVIPNFQMGNTYKIRLTVLGNYIQIKLNGEVVTEWTLATNKVLASASGYFGLSHTGEFGVEFDNVVAVSVPANGISVNEDIASYVTLPSRNMYAAGETVTLTVDTETLDSTTLKVNGGAVEVTGSNGTYTFTMPTEAVEITCDKLVLSANQVLYTNDGTEALSSDLWSAPISLTDGKLTGAITSKYNTVMKDGWFTVTLQMPETLPAAANQQVMIEAIEVTSKIEIEFGLFYQTSGMKYRGFIRSTNTNYGTSNSSTYVYPAEATNIGGDISGKEVTLSMRKVGNYFELRIVCEGVIDKTFPFTLGDITTSDGASVVTTIENAEFNFGLSLPAFGGMTVESIEIGRMNEVATVSVDAASKDLITIPQVKDPKDTKVLRDRTAYQIGEIIALEVSGNAKDVKANGVAVANTAAFQVNENVVLTAELDTAPYYVADENVLLHNNYGTAGGTLQSIISDYNATIAGGYVVSATVTTHTQKTGDGTPLTSYPWHGIEVNSVDFRVRPIDLANNIYSVGIRYGGAWVASDDGVVGTAMTNIPALPGQMNVGADNAVTFEQAIKVKDGVYTLYINGYAVCTYTNTTATIGNVRLWAAKNGSLTGDNGSTWGFTVDHTNVRIDRLGSVNETTFGQKQLALDEDLAMDFYIALPENTTATTATITLAGKDTVVDLTTAERKALVDSNMVGWYSWYIVTANVPVKEADSNITVTVDGKSYTYAVTDYLDYIVNSDAPEYAAAKATAQSLLDYSATAASYFADRTGAAELPAELAARLENVTIADTYKPTRTGTNDYVNLYGCSLEAVEKANICIYFKVGATYEWSNEAVTVKIGETAVNNFVVEDAGNGYKRVKITGIHAADLDVVYTVSVAGLTINYSGLSYAYTALNSDTSANLQTMAKALYNYWAAAQAMN